MKKKQKVKVSDSAARKQARHDIVSDPDLQQTPPSEDLDEGGLARKDNSNEKAFDALERKRSKPLRQVP